jgi:hypothetical protein
LAEVVGDYNAAEQDKKDMQEGAKKFADIMQNARIKFIAAGVNKFRDYLDYARELNVCTKNLCSLCFVWDLRGGQGDSPKYSPKKYDKNRSAWVVDNDRMKEIDKEVTTNFYTIKKFLEDSKSEDEDVKSAIASIPKIIEFKETN